MEQVYQSAVEYYAGMLQDIRNARQSVDLEVYIFLDDLLGRQFITALQEAARRGVSVRVLVDGVGSGIGAHQWLAELQQAGVKTRIYHPLPWRFWHWSYATQRHSGMAKFMFLASFLNRRNHRKILVIDGSTAWIGSFNLCCEHLPKSHGGEGWHDCGVRLETANAQELLCAMNRAWHGEINAKPPLPSGQFRLNYTRALRRRALKTMLRHIGQARRHIWITNAYFIPSAKILRALSYAAQRGIDVRLMVPAQSDVVFMPWATAQFYRHLLHAGVRIFEYQAGVLHAKTMVIDHWVSVGSSNLNHRSLLHDLEADAVLHESASVLAVKRQYLHNQINAVEIDQAEVQKASWLRRLFGRLILLLRYWL